MWTFHSTLFEVAYPQTQKLVDTCFYMKYDYLFKLNCAELYKNGQWPETPEGIGQRNFRKRITTWVKIANLHGWML